MQSPPAFCPAQARECRRSLKQARQLSGADAQSEVSKLLLLLTTWFVTDVQGSFKDAAGQPGLPLAPLSFRRVSDPLLKGTAFQILLPPALKAATG